MEAGLGLVLLTSLPLYDEPVQHGSFGLDRGRERQRKGRSPRRLRRRSERQQAVSHQPPRESGARLLLDPLCLPQPR